MCLEVVVGRMGEERCGDGENGEEGDSEKRKKREREHGEETIR